MSVIESKQVRIRGTVQGVGFRPTVWRLAHDHKLVGEVQNDGEGVLIKISGIQSDLTNFLTRLPNEIPVLAKIDAMEVQTLNLNQGTYDSFKISHSNQGASHTQVSVDAATCQPCQDEIFNVAERRYQYPFTNCTHCGPRLSIIEGIPYDRDNTTMSHFPMCEQCKVEYQNPADRRFHAQPIACHQCGPGIYSQATDLNPDHFVEPCKPDDSVKQSQHSLEQVNDYLAQGKIVAIRGIGGFHLSCDASNTEAVARLRQRKHRYAKPFALMTHNLAIIAHHCHLSTIEKQQLQSFQAPIVLLTKKENEPLDLSSKYAHLSEKISPGTNLLGFMLPYTPLHWLITQKFGKPLVMTSGNFSNEPQIIDNHDAHKKLKDVADLILFHNRNIANRIDDSVVRCMAGKARLLRRARGYAPGSIIMPKGFEKSPDILAFGGELKSTFCLLKEGSAIVSQHQGDLEDVDTFEDYEKNLALYARLFDHKPCCLVADKHPEYLSNKLAKKQLSNYSPATELIEVQHHHAHIASCLAENKIPLDHPKVLGIAVDGLGFGLDETFWGGEFLLADYCEFQRLACFKPIAMIGGTQAIIEPWRNTYAHILNAMSWDEFQTRFGETKLYAFLVSQPLDIINEMLNEQINVPLASSCGRLFDAVAAATGICQQRVQFEGQGAIELERHVQANMLKTEAINFPYPFAIETKKIVGTSKNEATFYSLNFAKMWSPLLEDIRNETALEIMASRFHAGLIESIVSMVGLLAKQYDFNTVVLSGGCMQNRFLMEGVNSQLKNKGLACLSHSQLPSNDGGISLGQVAIAAAQLLNKK